MDNSNNKAARKVRELTSHLEEEDLWDLEDSWEDEEGDGDNTTEADETTEADPAAEEKAETGDLFDAAQDRREEDAAPPPADEQADEHETGTEENPEETSKENPEAAQEETPEETPEVTPEETPEEPSGESASVADPGGEGQPAAPKDTFDDPELTPEEAARKSAADLIRKAGLSTAEKIALAAVALMFAGLAVWGYMFLRKHNRLATTEATIEFPVKGEHAVVSGFKTFWKNPDDDSRVRLGALVVPAAEITLADDSSGTGALRLYFYNTEKTSVGDPITIAFEGGRFSNGEKTIEVSASDGFHQEGDYSAYVLDRDLAWRVQLLEADSAAAAGSDFAELFKVPVEPVRK